MYNEKIVNTITGKEIIRNYTPEEVAQVEEEILKSQLKKQEREKKEADRQSALGKLAALGLTPEEIAAL